MGWMPVADTSYLSSDENSKKRLIRCDGIIIHTIGGGPGPALAATWSVSYNGHIWQHRNDNNQSAANYQGNPYYLAIENGDRGTNWPRWDPSSPRINWTIPPMTDAQIDSNARIVEYASWIKGFPLQLMPDSRLGSVGIAPHRWGINGDWTGYMYPGRVSVGQIWSTSYGKVCPTDGRITQIIDKIIPKARVYRKERFGILMQRRSPDMFVLTEVETTGGRVAIFTGEAHYDITKWRGTRLSVEAMINSGVLLEHRVDASEWNRLMGITTEI